MGLVPPIMAMVPWFTSTFWVTSPRIIGQFRQFHRSLIYQPLTMELLVKHQLKLRSVVVATT
jgi:hypothetical protein